MAVSFGKVSGALATVHNENTAALINLNADFTLVQLAAPGEYSVLGDTISKKRKVDAEEGTLHKTARRLGALFKDVLPITEELCRAYGIRVSEICAMQSTTLSRDHGGIFGSHLGLDTTSIWAAATSGSAAIQAHLLACMLARIFPVQEAISLWVELVEKRKTWIRVKQGNALYSSDHQNEIAASQQDISRSDLATWDSSARAWLQSADQAKKRQHIQTALILDNASVPVNNEPQTYDSIMKAWTTALEAMNHLVKGIPQRVQDGATLLAVSSWHLYPDMVVHGNTYAEVRQGDSIFKPGSLLTLGLQQARKDTKSVYWSLPLACLQFYGHPVRADRSTEVDNKRITCDQFGYVILGCLFEGWRDYAVNDEDGLERLGRITDLMALPHNSRFNHSEAPTWLIYLANAVQNYIDCDEGERIVAQQLVKLGRRWSTFLYEDTIRPPPPMFGLSTIFGLLDVLKDQNHKVDCLRKWVLDASYTGTDLVMEYHVQRDDFNWLEYASLVPFSPVHAQPLPKRTLQGNFKTPEAGAAKHYRWVLVSPFQLSLFVQFCEDFRNIDAAKEKLARLSRLSANSKIKHLLNEDITSIKETEELREVIIYAQRFRDIETRGEIFLPVINKLAPENEVPSQDRKLFFPQSEDFIEATRELLAIATNRQRPISHEHSVVSKPLIISRVLLGGLICLTFDRNLLESDLTHLLASGHPLNPIFVDNVFQPGKVDQESLQQFFDTQDGAVKILIKRLKACAMMSEVYHLLPGAEISTAVLKSSLSAAKWVADTRTELTRSDAFACIAMFDSGNCNLHPDSLNQVFALSSGNSIYILASLLCDPYESPGRAEIRRVVGNVGRPGMTFLISPPEVKTREADPEQWMSINHAHFNGQPENHFEKTSIHLSFTDYEIPLIPDGSHQHIIDRVFVLVETLVSVYDGQTWVGEVDILKTFRMGDISRIKNDRHCSTNERCDPYEAAVKKFPYLAATSIENWDELIEAPNSGTVVVKAHKNWLARLAITAIAVKYGFTPLILPEEVCWSCCSRAFPGRKEKYALIW